MDMFIYPLILLGSFSTGYSLLRIGFPKKQELSYLEKGSYGLVLGVITFAPAVYVGLKIGMSGFFVTAILAYLLLFSLLYTKRFFLHETDSVELIKETKFKEKIPLSVLTNEEKEELLNKNKTNNPTVLTQKIIQTKDNPPPTPKREIFKEKEDNLMETLRIKTKQKPEESEEEKKKMLAKLRELGKEISKKEETSKKEEISKKEEKPSIIEENDLEELEEEEEY